MVVGILRLTLYLPENHSLKGKRQVLRAIKARVRTKFNVSIVESDSHDMWQRAELGIGDGLIRFSAGLEHPDDLIEDLLTAMEKV